MKPKPWTWLALVLALASAASLAPAQVPAAARETGSGTPAAVVPAPTPTAPSGLRTLYLIRHGYYDAKDPADPRVGRHLDDLGREQARLVGERLKALPVAWDTVRTSTFTRAMETGDIIARVLEVPVRRDSLLSECTPPANRRDIVYDTPGEADSSLAQMEAAWAAYARPAPGGDVHQVLVCHGNVIRWFVTRALGVDTRQWGQMEIANGSLTVITIKPDGSTRLVIFSEVGHLPLERQTWSGRGPGWAPPAGARR